MISHKCREGIKDKTVEYKIRASGPCLGAEVSKGSQNASGRAQSLDGSGTICI
jgi:hypothetical protein